MAAAAIAVVVAATASLIWWTSDARATISRPAATSAPNPTLAREVPASLKQLWTAASPATTAPVIVGGTVATGDGREVDGRDPGTGQTRWSYARDRDLCGLSWVYHYAVAVYHDDRGCGQVSTIDGSTGRRGAARSSYADPQVRLSSDGATVLSVGDTRLELWRSDMVRMLSLRRDRRPGETVVAGVALRMQAGLGGGQLVDGFGAGELREPGRPATRPVAPGQGRRRTSTTPRRGARDRVELRCARADRLGKQHGGVSAGISGAQPRVDVIDEMGTKVASTLLPKAPSNWRRYRRRATW